MRRGLCANAGKSRVDASNRLLDSTRRLSFSASGLNWLEQNPTGGPLKRCFFGLLLQRVVETVSLSPHALPSEPLASQFAQSVPLRHVVIDAVHRGACRTAYSMQKRKKPSTSSGRECDQSFTHLASAPLGCRSLVQRMTTMVAVRRPLMADPNRLTYSQVKLSVSSIITTCGICRKPAPLQECCVAGDGKAVHKHCHEETFVATRSNPSDTKKRDASKLSKIGSGSV